jgi:hypothetical protein
MPEIVVFSVRVGVPVLAGRLARKVV